MLALLLYAINNDFLLTENNDINWNCYTNLNLFSKYNTIKV